LNSARSKKMGFSCAIQLSGWSGRGFKVAGVKNTYSLTLTSASRIVP